MYEALRDVSVSYITGWWDIPYTGGGRAVFPKGERLRVTQVGPGREPAGAYCDPLRYDALHEQIVPAVERADPLYVRYCLSVDTADLNGAFRSVEACRATPVDGLDSMAAAALSDVPAQLPSGVSETV